MEIKLIKMEIQNFMGIKALDIDFDGKSTKIHGDNATGKTTLKHAFNWLLFGKNAEGKVDFGIKPVDENGDVIHHLETSVKAQFEVDGKPIIFERALKESWTRKRGSATETFTGHETNFFVNNVPKKKTEYTTEINKLINEDLFKMLTDPLYFNTRLKWQDRREMLIDICGDIKAEDVFQRNEELLPLKVELNVNGLSPDEYRTVLQRDMKAINKELAVIPSQITEAELAKPTSVGKVDLTKKKALQDEADGLISQKNAIINGVEIVQLNSDKSMLERDIKSLRIITRTDTRAYAEIQLLERSIAEWERSVQKNTFERDRIDSRLKEIATAKRRLSDEWDTEFDKTFFGATCPTCGQNLPEDILEEKKKAFNMDKARKLDRIERELKELKQETANLQFERADYSNNIQTLSNTIEANRRQIKGKESEVLKEIAESQELYNAEYDKLKMRIAEIDSKIANYNEHSEAELVVIDERLVAINNELHGINIIEASIETEKRQNDRIKELMDRQAQLSRAYMDKERLLAMTEQFVIAKVQMLNDKINSRFKYASFKLFKENINGGIEETCEVTYNGVPFRDLNTAMKINIGLDVINTLSKKNDTCSPIFIDGAEAVTKFIPTEAQKVLLIVDEKYKQLHIEQED